MLAFFTKELREGIATYKSLLLLSIFIGFGIMSPLTAKLMPTILSSVTTPAIAAQFGEPTAIDAWLQFFKNVPQLGLVLFLLTMSTTVSKEKPYLPILLAQGLTRPQLLNAKALYLTALWTLCYSISASITYGYTLYYWDMSVVHHLLPALIGVYAFGIFFILLVLAGNALGGTTASGLVTAVITLVVLVLFQTFYPSKYNPLHVMSGLDAHLAGAPLQIYPALIAMLAVLLFVYPLSLLQYNKKEAGT